MRQIWKYTIAPGLNRVQIPIGAVPLCVQVQQGEPQMWMLVDPSAATKERHFQSVMTGEPFTDEDKSYIGTAQIGGIVVHVFECFQ